MFSSRSNFRTVRDPHFKIIVQTITDSDQVIREALDAGARGFVLKCDGEDLTLLVRRSVVHGRVGETKTEASRLPLPVDPRLAGAFTKHRRRSV